MDTLSYILDQFVNGLQLGAVYALIALGYTMVYGVLRLINFAHGDIFMVGAFVAYLFIARLGMPIYYVFIITMFVTSLIAYFIERIAYRPLRDRYGISYIDAFMLAAFLAYFLVALFTCRLVVAIPSAVVAAGLVKFLTGRNKGKSFKPVPKISLLITAVGVSLFLEYFCSLKGVFSPDYLAFPRPFEVKAYDLKLIAITNIQILIFAATFVSLGLLYFLVYETKQGQAMRAVSHDQETAALMGINIDATISLTFTVGAALAGVGGILYSMAYPQINVFMGVMPGIKSFIAAVLGGIGIIHGAVIGGLIIGLSEVFVSAFISSTFRDGFIFIILLLVLLFKPTGIFGKRIDKV